jgi:hypothetical protein
MTTDEIESAIEHAINALGLAKLALSKSSIPVFSESDVLRKANGLTPVRSDDAAKAATAALDDLNARLDRLEAAKDLAAQVRKTWRIA